LAPRQFFTVVLVAPVALQLASVVHAQSTFRFVVALHDAAAAPGAVSVIIVGTAAVITAALRRNRRRSIDSELPT